MDRARAKKIGSSVALLAVGSLLVVVGFNAGYADGSTFSAAYYLTGLLGVLVAAAGLMGFRKMAREE